MRYISHTCQFTGPIPTPYIHPWFCTCLGCWLQWYTSQVFFSHHPMCRALHHSALPSASHVSCISPSTWWSGRYQLWQLLCRKARSLVHEYYIIGHCSNRAHRQEAGQGQPLDPLQRVHFFESPKWYFTSNSLLREKELRRVSWAEWEICPWTASVSFAYDLPSSFPIYFSISFLAVFKRRHPSAAWYELNWQVRIRTTYWCPRLLSGL